MKESNCPHKNISPVWVDRSTPREFWPGGRKDGETYRVVGKRCADCGKWFEGGPKK